MAIIAYDIKNGIKYAKICTSQRVDGKVKSIQKSLGRVLDEEKCIFQNREKGVFTYDVKTDTYGVPDAAFVPKVQRANRREKLILDFGDAYFVDAFMQKKGLWPCVLSLGYGNPDSLKAMVLYYILQNMACVHASTWWEGSYARILYPDANLTSQRISDMFSYIGNEDSYREFFSSYLPLIAKGNAGENIAIDSTGLPNSIRFPLTAISSHNGKISNEMRLIYVLHQETGLPLFFRYCPGNIIDVSTLAKTLYELKAYGVNTKFALLDAGYLSKDNIDELYRNKVSFLSRLKENTTIYKDAVKAHLNELETEENLVSYNGRICYIRTDEVQLEGGHTAYVYLCRDIAMRNIESGKLMDNVAKGRIDKSQAFDIMATQGIFALISSRRVAKDKVLSSYYARQQIEQVFDISKNYTNLLPLRVESEDTLRGHLIVSFIAASVVRMLQMDIKDSPYTPTSVFMNLRNHKCKVFSDNVLPQEHNKKCNDIYKLIGLKVPHLIGVKSEDFPV